MKKIFIIIIFALHGLVSFCQTQAIRDSFVGIYFCNGTFIANEQTSYFTDTLKPYPDVSDSISFFVYDSVVCCWSEKMKFETDSTFRSTPYGDHHGTYQYPDSMFIFRNCFSPLGCYVLYDCHKVGYLININKLSNTQNVFINYPNPSNDKLYIISKGNKGNCHFNIYNIEGKLIYNGDFFITNSYFPFEVDIQSLTQGLYLINIYIENKNYNFKFLKED